MVLLNQRLNFYFMGDVNVKKYYAVLINLSDGNVLDGTGEIVEKLPMLVDRGGFNGVIKVQQYWINLNQVTNLMFLTEKQYLKWQQLKQKNQQKNHK